MREKKSAFGTVLAKLRKQRDWRQHDLATMSGVSGPDISAIERGTRYPEPETVLKLAQVFGSSRSQLITAYFNDDRADGLSRRGFLGAIVSLVSEYLLLQGTNPAIQLSLQSVEAAQEIEEALDYLFIRVLHHTGLDTKRVRDYTDPLLAKSKVINNQESQHIVAKALHLCAISHFSDNDAPPDIAGGYHEHAMSIANKLDDAELQYQVMLGHVVYHRRRRAYATARELVRKIYEGAYGPPSLSTGAMAYVELAHIEFFQHPNNADSFDNAIHKAFIYPQTGVQLPGTFQPF
jgi:transcriptional regulator with XRE-family HTH domain